MTETTVVVEQNSVDTDLSSKFDVLRKFKEEKLSNLKSTSEFFDRNKFNVSTSLQVVSQRWSKLYLDSAVSGGLFSVELTNWVLLFTIAFAYGGFHFLSKLNSPVIAGGMTFSISSLYTGYAVITFLLFFISGATGTLLWVVGAAVLLILGHAALLEPGLEGDFADNQA